MHYFFFQQDDIFAHYSRIFTSLLNVKFEDQWLSIFPDRSSDLTIMDFYLYERLKQIVYL